MLISHYPHWKMTANRPLCGEREEFHNWTAHFRRRGNNFTFLAPLKCATCRGMPDTTKRHPKRPKLVVFTDGSQPDAQHATSAWRAEYDYYHRGREGGSDRFIPMPNLVIQQCRKQH